MKKHFYLLLFVSLIVIQFNGSAQRYKAAELEYRQYTVSAGKIVDTAVLNFLKPYSDSLNKMLSTVIGFATASLYSKQPEGTLGNFAADAMRYMAEKKFNRKVDMAAINPGGLRSYLPKGEISVRNVYEIMPFDNLVVLQELKGTQLKSFLDHTANKGGWGLSGVKMVIRNRQADSVYVGGKLLDPGATYVVANTDYVANGGDYTESLKGIRVSSIGYLFRDALLEYIAMITKEGRPITAQIENRVVHADR